MPCPRFSFFAIKAKKYFTGLQLFSHCQISDVLSSPIGRHSHGGWGIFAHLVPWQKTKSLLFSGATDPAFRRYPSAQIHSHLGEWQAFPPAASLLVSLAPHIWSKVADSGSLLKVLSKDKIYNNEPTRLFAGNMSTFLWKFQQNNKYWNSQKTGRAKIFLSRSSETD